MSAMNLSSISRSRVDAFLPQEAKNNHRLDVGPIRLTSIAHAFNYRIAVLRDGVKQAARVGRSRRAAQKFLDDIDILGVTRWQPCFKLCARWLWTCRRGEAPNVTLACEPWGHVYHDNGSCECLSSDRTGASPAGPNMNGGVVPSPLGVYA